LEKVCLEELWALWQQRPFHLFQALKAKYPPHKSLRSE
jgi:hypothetical protein